MCGKETELQQSGGVRDKCTPLCDAICLSAWRIKLGFDLSEERRKYGAKDDETAITCLRDAWRLRSIERKNKA